MDQSRLETRVWEAGMRVQERATTEQAEAGGEDNGVRKADRRTGPTHRPGQRTAGTDDEVEGGELAMVSGVSVS